jgi:hypothetical protein
MNQEKVEGAAQVAQQLSPLMDWSNEYLQLQKRAFKKMTQSRSVDVITRAWAWDYMRDIDNEIISRN